MLTPSSTPILSGRKIIHSSYDCEHPNYQSNKPDYDLDLEAVDYSKSQPALRENQSGPVHVHGTNDPFEEIRSDIDSIKLTVGVGR